MSKEIASLYADIGAKTEGLKTNLKESKNDLNEYKGSWIDLWSMIDLAGQAVGAFKTFVDESIGMTVEYGGQVRDLSRLIGATPEEASKLIQAGDDVKLSYEKLTTALEQAIRKGVEPSIEGIGKLADEYISIKDPIERSKFLMDNFGRSGADLGPLMELGSEGIKALGDEAEILGLTMDRDSVEAVKNYEKAMGGLQGSLEMVKLEIGKEFIPWLTKAADTLGLLLTWNDRIVDSLDKHEDEVRDTSTSYEDYIEEIERAAKSAGYQVTAEGDLISVGITSGGVKRTLIEANYALTQSEYDLKDMMDTRKESVEKMQEATKNLIDHEELQRQAEEKIKQSMEELTTFMSGRLGEENEKYEEKLGDLQTELEDTRLKIEELSNQDNLTEEQRGQLDELKGKYEDIQTQIKENADEHDEATRRILFDLLQQQLSVDGLSTKEAEALGSVAENWGLIDKPTKDAWDRMQEYIGSLGTAQIDAEDLWKAVNNIPNEKEIVIIPNTSLLEQYFPGGEIHEAFQTGADFVVPPGFAGDQFPFMASTGERVQVTPASEVGREGGTGGNWAYLANEIKQLRMELVNQPRPASANDISRAIRDAILMVSG